METEQEISIEVLQEGAQDAQIPKDGDQVVVHYDGYLESGESFDSSRQRGQPFKFVLGEGMVIKGWEEAARRMRVGEKSRVKIPPHLAYGKAGHPGKIPPNATLTFEIEILETAPKPKEIWEMGADERVEGGRREKEEGNRFLQSGQLEKAANHYGEAIAYFEQWDEWEAQLKKTAGPLRMGCLLNLANIHLRLGSYTEAVRNTDEVLKSDPKNTKALYRRGVAHLNLGELVDAKADLLQAARNSPSDPVVRKELENCKKQMRERDEADSKRFGGMFERLHLYEQTKDQESEEPKKENEISSES